MISSYTDQDSLYSFLTRYRILKTVTKVTGALQRSDTGTTCINRVIPYFWTKYNSLNKNNVGLK